MKYTQMRVTPTFGLAIIIQLYMPSGDWALERYTVSTVGKRVM